MFSCSHSSPLNNTDTMSKRLVHDEKPGEEERVDAKSKTKFSADKSPITLDSSASYSPGCSKHKVRYGRPVAKGLNENTASSSQM